MNDSYKDKLDLFANKIKTDSNRTPIQKVSKVRKEIKAEPEVQLNLWIPKTLMKKLKSDALEADISLKELVTSKLL